jgi:hypothetical protein
MANGLFATRNIGTPGEIQRLMQLEQEKRIRDAGAGFTNPLVRARAMAGQGMQEAISGIGTGLTGLLGGQVRMDPRMQEAVKRNRVRTTMMQKYKDAAADGVVTYEERMAIAADLDAAGFPNEAERARASARAIRKESRDVSRDKFDREKFAITTELKELEMEQNRVQANMRMAISQNKQEDLEQYRKQLQDIQQERLKLEKRRVKVLENKPSAGLPKKITSTMVTALRGTLDNEFKLLGADSNLGNALQKKYKFSRLPNPRKAAVILQDVVDYMRRKGITEGTAYSKVLKRMYKEGEFGTPEDEENPSGTTKPELRIRKQQKPPGQ